MVVDGRDEVSGAVDASARASILRAARASHVAVKLARNGDAIAIEVGSPPASEGVAQLKIATTERGLRTPAVHGPVVRSFRYVADVAAHGVKTTVQEPARAGVRVVAIVEARDTLHVLGAATVD
jgi:hypothetical protein